ncbi:MAG: ABC transporter substrate-binding protein [Rhodospirillaceae bacterium]|nr:ABC transporter substrate-binding protein [Rhodospirillaceae bacterium]
MGRLTISLAGVEYDRTRALFNGAVTINGCETITLALSPEEAFHRAFRNGDFDVTELSLASHMHLVDRGQNNYVAIPVFPSRLFRHSAIYIRSDRGIDRPQDLRGKIVGVPEYQITAAVWVRGILEDDFGLRPSEIRWRTGGLIDPGRREKTTLALPREVDLQPIAYGQTLNNLFEAGEIDALISVIPPRSLGKNLIIRRLFEDYRAVEEDYFRRTRIFPIMHVIGIRKVLAARHPWLPVNVYNAYLEAKKLCYYNNEKLGHLYTTLPWAVDELERTRSLMGQDFWSYGISTNREELETIGRYMCSQGLTTRQLVPEDIFFASTLELAKT